MKHNYPYFEIIGWAILTGTIGASTVAAGVDFSHVTPNDVRDIALAFISQGATAAVGLIRMLNVQAPKNE